MRYLPQSDDDIIEMLDKIGASSIEDLFAQIPDRARSKKTLNLPPPLTEPELMAHLTELARANKTDGLTSFMGAGAYAHHVSPVVDQMLNRSEFYTAYTPYQAEISQGTLQAIFEFQTIICRLFGMGVANASMYDGASAAAEAALMTRRLSGKQQILLSAGLHPEYIQVIETYLRGLDKGRPKIELIPLDSETGYTDLSVLKSMLTEQVAGVLVGYPNFFGVVDRLDEVAKMAAEVGAFTVSVTTEPMSLGVISPPGELGADISVGEGQPLGVPVSFGGPGLGLFSCRDDRRLLRQLPGRLCGETEDIHGKRGYVLTLSTREQHIRRENATSNICTNHGLLALAVTVNMSLLGRTGYQKVSRLCLSRTEYLKGEISKLNGFEVVHKGPTFNEFAVRANNKSAKEILDHLESENILGGVALARFFPEMENTFLVAVTECHTRKQLDTYVEALNRS